MSDNALDKARRVLPALIVIVVCMQGAVVASSYYIATDDWFLVDFGRDAVDMERLTARQTRGTPAIRPVSLLLARAEHLLFGDAATPRLLLHAALHGAAVWLIFLLVGSIERLSRLAPACALLFAVHPLHAEPLAWYHSGHTTLPLAVLALATMVAFARRWPAVVGLSIFVLALLTRENAVVVAPCLLGLAWMEQAPTRSWWRAFGRAAPYLILTGAYVCVRSWQVLSALDSGDGAFLPLAQDPLSVLVHMIVHFAAPVQAGVSAAFVVATLALAAWTLWCTVRTGTDATLTWVVCVAWVGLWCAPFVPLYETSDDLIEALTTGYERRWYHLYLPAAGVALLLARALHQRPRLGIGIVLGLLTLQLVNASRLTDYGEAMREARGSIEVLLASDRPLVFEFPTEQTVLSELAEHQVVAIPRSFRGHTRPVYRRYGDGDHVRAVLDEFGYPTWAAVPRNVALPSDSLEVRWVEAARRFKAQERRLGVSEYPL